MRKRNREIRWKNMTHLWNWPMVSGKLAHRYTDHPSCFYNASMIDHIFTESFSIYLRGLGCSLDLIWLWIDVSIDVCRVDWYFSWIMISLTKWRPQSTQPGIYWDNLSDSVSWFHMVHFITLKTVGKLDNLSSVTPNEKSSHRTCFYESDEKKSFVVVTYISPNSWCLKKLLKLPKIAFWQEKKENLKWWFYEWGLTRSFSL